MTLVNGGEALERVLARARENVEADRWVRTETATEMLSHDRPSEEVTSDGTADTERGRDGE